MLEVCVEDLRGLRVARDGGAGRIELCSALDLGGLTPSLALMRGAVGQGIPVHALIRGRAGDFLYDAQEQAVQLGDSLAAIEAGVDGLVIGAGGAAGLDRALLEDWVGVVRAAASARGAPLSLTLHRVFDLLEDPFEGLELAIELGFERVLTSAGQVSAGDGVARFAQLATQAAGRIVLLAGGGLVPEAIAALRAAGVDEFHASCRAAAPHEGDARLRELGFVAGPLRVTDAQRVAAYVAAAGGA
ncbi:copper homeostasis protein CutC [Novosphingobium sp. 1949]|uniref:PF03932 family protein CutC n=1 Tax=Novosphingobium organovorum TaxID=2930092 RepID=A0ABT0BIS9_9SPHN|nr:copper homeostasis protein CutC [Novosphingobium organovorum]MCJ2184967.1 copper homeostasis protein CutC [Novosphingobium organovorum]